MPRNTLMDPPIESLLDKVDSKFTLVALGSARARQVNSYYNSLGEGLGRIAAPQVTSVSGKPLSIAFEEIAAGKVVYERTAVEPTEEVNGEEKGLSEVTDPAVALGAIAEVAVVVDDEGPAAG
jgi:DNA-directed RNA polymerase subunit omega